jgi:hypothetical protein
MGKIAQLDLVLGKDIGILAESQAFQPFTETADGDLPVESGQRHS